MTFQEQLDAARQYAEDTAAIFGQEIDWDPRNSSFWPTSGGVVVDPNTGAPVPTGGFSLSQPVIGGFTGTDLIMAGGLAFLLSRVLRSGRGRR